MVNFNDNKYLLELDNAIKSKTGRIIIEYIRDSLADNAFTKIDRTKSNAEVGENFKAAAIANEKLNEILSFFDSRVK